MKIAVLADDINDFKKFVTGQSESVGFNITQYNRTVIRSEYGVSYYYITCISQTRTTLFYDYVNFCNKTTPKKELIESIERRISQFQLLGGFSFKPNDKLIKSMKKMSKVRAKLKDRYSRNTGLLSTHSDYQELLIDMKLSGYPADSLGKITIVIIVPRWYQPIKRFLFLKRLTILQHRVKFRRLLGIHLDYRFVF